MKALLLDPAPDETVRACVAGGLEVVRVRDVAEGRARLSQGGWALVDGRIAEPLPLEEEIARRLDLFYDRLRDGRADGLYARVMREVERPLLARALARARGVRASAAAALGIDRGTLTRRMRALGIEEP
jgi:Fis family transcriptional regulator, factor for inversion stimulation protein